MKIILRNIAAVVLGVVIGSMVNMALITISGKLIPPPGGADVTTMEGLQAALPLFEPKHFIFPFLAHALGTLVGAALAYAVAGSRKAVFAYLISAFFLVGGIMNVAMLPAPVWFSALDLILAYLPMAWLVARRAKT